MTLYEIKTTVLTESNNETPESPSGHHLLVFSNWLMRSLKIELSLNNIIKLSKMIGNVFNLSGKIPLYVLRISLELLWATYYTFDNKNNFNDYNIMKLSLCQKRRVVNKLFLCLLLPYLCNYIFPNDVILKEVFSFSFSFFYFRFSVWARKNVSR